MSKVIQIITKRGTVELTVNPGDTLSDLKKLISNGLGEDAGSFQNSILVTKHKRLEQAQDNIYENVHEGDVVNLVEGNILG